ncbi:hypothetical protein Y032_0482g2286 [Ancylostoma ceylanicum]|nr:hypothetical protein Y032_0482g2286 [Ancylostoma ceylanicum]
MEVLIVLWRLNTMSESQMLGLSNDLYTTCDILPTSPPLRVFYLHLCLSTPNRLRLYVRADCYQWITYNKQRMINHFPCSFRVASVTYCCN